MHLHHPCAGLSRWNDSLLVDLRLAGLVEAWAAGAMWSEVSRRRVKVAAGGTVLSPLFLLFYDYQQALGCRPMPHHPLTPFCVLTVPSMPSVPLMWPGLQHRSWETQHWTMVTLRACSCAPPTSSGRQVLAGMGGDHFKAHRV